MPRSLVSTVVTTLVARFLTSTLAPGTSAPCGSVMVPLMVARDSCANATLKNVQTAIESCTRDIDLLIAPPTRAYRKGLKIPSKTRGPHEPAVHLRWIIEYGGPNPLTSLNLAQRIRNSQSRQTRPRPDSPHLPGHRRSPAVPSDFVHCQVSRCRHIECGPHRRRARHKSCVPERG